MKMSQYNLQRMKTAMHQWMKAAMKTMKMKEGFMEIASMEVHQAQIAQ